MVLSNLKGDLFMILPKISSQTVIGQIDQSVIDLLGLPISSGAPIIIGPLNEKHMIDEHCENYIKYFGEIGSILKNPDYVIPHKTGSLQYVKVFDEHVMVAVRLSSNGVYFARSLYVMSQEKVDRWGYLFEKYSLVKP